MSSALFILRWSCCFKCALSVLWRFYNKTFYLIKQRLLVPVAILFFSDGTGLRHSWGQRGDRRRSLYDAYGTEGSDDVNFKLLKISFLSKAYILPVWCPGNSCFWNFQDCHNMKWNAYSPKCRNFQDCHNMMWNAYSPKCRNFHPNDVNSKCKDHRRLIMWKPVETHAQTHDAQKPF